MTSVTEAPTARAPGPGRRRLLAAAAVVAACAAVLAGAATFVPRPPGRPAADLSDDFNDPVRSAQIWDQVTPYFVVAPAEGRLEVSVTGAGEMVWGGLKCRELFDFRGASWHVRADLEDMDDVHAEAKFAVTKVHGRDYASIEAGKPSAAESRRLHLSRMYGGDLREKFIPYDPVAHRWWRLRHDAASGRMNWEASPDGLAWTTLHSEECGYPVDRVKAEIYAGRFGTEPSKGTVVYRSFNTAPR